MSSRLAIDAGQTGVRLRHRHDDHETEWSEPGIRTDLPLLPQLVRVLARAAAAGHRAYSVGIGVSGLTSAATDPGQLLAAAKPLGTRRLLLAHDSVTGYLGALGSARGAVVAAGTGVVTLAVGTARVARVDGWGNLIGDAGSGYWLGRAALEAVMRAHDGRGCATALAAVVRADFPDLESAYIELQGDPARVRRIAAYARPLIELAGSDPVATSLVEAGAAELACSVVAGLRRVGEDAVEAPQVRAIGGLFGAPVLARAFEAELRALLPAVELRIGEARPLDGAAALIDVRDASALADHVATAQTTATSPGG